MHLLSTITASTLLLSATAIPLFPKRQAIDGLFGLSVAADNNFDISSILYPKLSFANGSAYFGEVKYQFYSEPLVLSGAGVAGDVNGGLSFLSIHSSPTGYQYGYIRPNATAPMGFSVPHTGGVIPVDAVSTGFSFSGGGPLVWEGKNQFWACQNPELVAMNTYQVWWNGAGEFPVGVDCKGPIGIDEIDGCQRGN